MKSVFVSSTFRDMNFERDVLNRNIAPKLNYQLAKYNQSLRILDLRWGVDTTEMSEQDASERVLSTCFKAIDNCKPYIIVLIGDRYGYIPDGSDISVTHMEILRGVFENNDRKNIYIYLRNSDYTSVPESFKNYYIESKEESAALLNDLKAKLQREYGDRCRIYNATWSQEFECMVSEDFESLVYSDLERDVLLENRCVVYHSELHRQLCENEELIADNIRYSYCNFEKISTDVKNIFITEAPYGIIGDGGTGKSVYMSLLCSNLREAGYKSYILFCGDNAFSASYRNAAEMLLYIFSCDLGEDYYYEKNALLSYDEIISHIIEKRSLIKKKYILMLDAVDKCDSGMINFVYWCGSFLSEQIKIVFSSRMIPAIEEYKTFFVLNEMTYDRVDYRGMIACILNLYGKSISENLIDLILEKVSTPLQLNLLLQRLLSLRGSDFDAIQKSGSGMEAINAYLKQIIDESPKEIEELIGAYLKELLEDTQNPKFVVYLLSVLSYCEYGLHEDDIRALYEYSRVKWVELDYIDFLERYNFFVRIRDNGRLDISHDIIRQTFDEYFEDDKKMICFLISNHFLNRGEQNSAAIRTFFDAVYSSEQFNVLYEYLMRYKGCFFSIDAGKEEVTTELKNGLCKLFMKDRGKFIIDAANCCKSEVELAEFQQIFSTSLLYINDYLDNETALTIAYAVMLIPTQVQSEFFDGDFWDMELLSCERFLKRQEVKQKDIDDFIRYYNNAAAKNNKRGGKASKKDDSVDQMINSLRSADPLNQAVIATKLSKIARDMAQNEKTARDSERLSLELISFFDYVYEQEDKLEAHILYADVYTTLGVAYKTLKEWEKGIHYDTLSLNLYKKIYENNPSAEMFKKYRARIYNVANITEAWAMAEKTNVELWEKTAEWYKKAYDLELKAVSSEISARDILQSASTILSLGTALVNTGRADEGIGKYKEGIAIFINTVKSQGCGELYAELTIRLMECVYQLVVCENFEAAYDFSLEVCGYLQYVIETKDNDLIEKINTICRAFSNNLNDIIRALHEEQKGDGEMIVSWILYNVYLAILPVAPFEVKANLIITKCNICATIFWQLKDYARAYEEYIDLINLVYEKDLACADENGRFVDEANSRLVDAYARCILCMDRLNNDTEVENLVGAAPGWAKYCAAHLNIVKGDHPRVLYEMFSQLMRNKSRVAFVLLMMAFSATQDEDYDPTEHPETMELIMKTVSQLKQGEEE